MQHEELTRNWLYSTPHSMAFAATSDLYYVASSPVCIISYADITHAIANPLMSSIHLTPQSSAHLLTLTGTMAECDGISRAYHIDRDAGFVLD